MLQKTQNILWHGECSCLQHWNHLYSWWRITWTIVNPLRTQQISQWNRCSTYLQDWCPNKQMTSMEWKQLPGKILHGSMSLVMNKSSVFSAQRSTSFQILYCVLERKTRTSQTNTPWEQRLKWFKTTKCRALDRIDGEPIEFEWKNFPGFTTLQLSHKVQELLLRLSGTPEKFTGGIIFMSMLNNISWDQRTTRKNAI